MTTKHSPRAGFARPVALFTTGAILVPTILAGCGGNKAEQTDSIPPPGSRMTAPPPAKGSANAPKAGLTTKQKMVALAGAAALFYVYKKYSASKAASGVQYHKSEANGRIYYRDPKTKQAIYVTPPAQPVMIPESEARQYQGYAGYNNNAAGQQFGGYGYNQNGAYQGGVPAPTM